MSGILKIMESGHQKLLTRAILLEQEGNYLSAEGSLNDAIDVANASGSVDERALCYCHLAMFLDRQGRTVEAAGIRRIIEVLVHV